MPEDTLEQIATLHTLGLADLVHRTNMINEQLLEWVERGAPGDPAALEAAKATAQAFLDCIPTAEHPESATFVDIVTYNVSNIIHVLGDGLTIRYLQE
ncbi:hypothetical protein [Deinococcus kurensis]|uniref:hypothetical protein n=1 Tax=Deinococcus kurensis TaxID=2662757 RepID=UPI0012D30296|nr:hypothetical protein [Deinococcus kurensis]